MNRAERRKNKWKKVRERMNLIKSLFWNIDDYIDSPVGIDIPKPIASINFDAYHVGTYIVDVKQDGSYSAVFIGSMYGVYK